MSLDRQRDALEERDTIEFQIATRISRNPNLVGKPTSRKRPHKEEMIQKLEMSVMASKLATCSQQYLRIDPKDVAEEIEQLKDPTMNLEQFSAIIDATKAQHVGIEFTHDLSGEYAMYLGTGNVTYKGEQARVKRKDILAKMTVGAVDVDMTFSVNEKWGASFDLRDLHRQYGNSLLYYEYLLSFPKDPRHLTALREYLLLFWRKSQPLVNCDEELTKLLAPQSKDNQTWCDACQKWFKLTTYTCHLEGKKHKKAAMASSSSSGPVLDDDLIILWLLSNPLLLVYEATKLAALRVATDREQMLEMVLLTGNESDYTDLEQSDKSEASDDDGDLFQNLPLGPNGKPMPHWLYKLQGLHKRYSCEICGGAAYQGRMTFERHFGQAKHNYGLKCLGVSEEQMDLFTGIILIKEAQQLAATLKEKPKDQGREIEMEDDEGNVLTKSEYDELKQQGLI